MDFRLCKAPFKLCAITSTVVYIIAGHSSSLNSEEAFRVILPPRTSTMLGQKTMEIQHPVIVFDPTNITNNLPHSPTLFDQIKSRTSSHLEEYFSKSGWWKCHFSSHTETISNLGAMAEMKAATPIA